MDLEIYRFSLGDDPQSQINGWIASSNISICFYFVDLWKMRGALVSSLTDFIIQAAMSPKKIF